MSTTDYKAAVDSNDIIMSYAPEAQWGVKPTAAFQQIRLDGEGFTSQKTRTRPNEINPAGQASAAITTKQESPGSLNFSVSAGTHKDLIAASIGGIFTAPLAISGSTIAATADSFTDSANGFGDIVVGQMIQVRGFTTTGLLANGIYRVNQAAAGEIHVTPAPGAAKVAGDTVTIRGSMCRNGKDFQSFYFQKFLDTAMYLQYPGAWPSGGSLDVGVGDYLKGTLAFINKDEVKATTGASTGAETLAPDGTVIDSINGIGQVYRNGSPIQAIIQKIGAKWNKEGARGQYGIGSAFAQGIGIGRLLVTGSLASYFKDFLLYDQFKSETGGPIWFTAIDNAGDGYAITFCNANIMNPKIVAGSASTDIMAEFEIEGAPDVSGTYGGLTLQIDYFGD